MSDDSADNNNNNNNSNDGAKVRSKMPLVAEILCILDFKNGELPKQWFVSFSMPAEGIDAEQRKVAEASDKLESLLRGKSAVDAEVKIAITSTRDVLPFELDTSGSGAEAHHPLAARLINIVKTADAAGCVMTVTKARVRVSLASKSNSTKYKRFIVAVLRSLPLHIDETMKINTGSGSNYYNYSTQSTLSTVDPMTLERQNEDTGAEIREQPQQPQQRQVDKGDKTYGAQALSSFLGTGNTRRISQAVDISKSTYGVRVSVVTDPRKDDGSRVLLIDSTREVTDVGEFVKELRQPLQYTFAQVKTGKLSIRIVARFPKSVVMGEVEQAVIDQIAFDALVIQTNNSNK